ncbi:MAG: hypothetical protein IPJ41_03430 [Phycisphaerales bacterium]|nr:hypothetical protein [Phycisphaerales bacterium]
MPTRTQPRVRPALPGAFTLVELTLVIAIIATLAAIAIPRFQGVGDRRRVDAAAERIRADILLARTDARAMSQSRIISFDADAETYEIVGRRGENRASDAYVVILNADPYRSVIVAADFGGSPSLTFDAYGQASASGGVMIQSGSIKRRVTIGGTDIEIVDGGGG